MSWNTQQRYLIVPGLRSSGPGHWQTHWEQALGASRVEQLDWDTPDLERWSARIVAAVNPDPRPAILIAHSFGSLASVHALRRIAPKIKGLLLVAPAAPEKFGISRLLPQLPLGIPSILVGSQSDPWLSLSRARALAASWDSEFLNLGDAGHINTDSGYGPWAGGLELLERLEAKQSGARSAPQRRVALPGFTTPALAQAAGFAW
ncbi:MAG TPA: alpha/beta hydrolase [Solimonas sp.]|nr:alpha/beta hydrolase [Solimonas sp.]